MNQIDREQVERKLRARAEELRRARTAVRREGQGMVEGELAHLDNHPADEGTETHEQELDATTEVFLEEEERRIAEALQALASGSYGTCLTCGKPIPGARLEAVPEAVRCIDCQRAFEAGHRQANRG